MCVVRRMIGVQVYSVVRWLFGCGLVGLLVVLIVPLFLSFLAMPGLCCFLRVTLPSERICAHNTLATAAVLLPHQMHSLQVPEAHQQQPSVYPCLSTCHKLPHLLALTG